MRTALKKIPNSATKIIHSSLVRSIIENLGDKMNFKRWKVRNNRVNGKIARKLYDIKGFHLENILLAADEQSGIAVDRSQVASV